MTNDNLVFYEKRNPKVKVTIFGVPIDLGKDGKGTNTGADYLREQGLMQMFVDVGFLTEDLGNIKCGQREDLEMGNQKVKFLKEIVRVSQETAKITNQEILAQNKVLVLGGDQCVSFGTIAGASAACKEDIGVIWIDVHADIMTHENNDSRRLFRLFCLMPSMAFGNSPRQKRGPGLNIAGASFVWASSNALGAFAQGVG